MTSSPFSTPTSQPVTCQPSRFWPFKTCVRTPVGSAPIAEATVNVMKQIDSGAMERFMYGSPEVGFRGQAPARNQPEAAAQPTGSIMARRHTRCKSLPRGGHGFAPAPLELRQWLVDKALEAGNRVKSLGIAADIFIQSRRAEQVLVKRQEIGQPPGVE